jgi:C4-dicarboxylate transporter DctQ subunit
MKRALQQFVSVVFGLNRALILLAGWAIIVIAALTSYSVIMRYVFNSPDIWTYPVSAYLLCFVVFASLAHTHQNGVHVRVDYFMSLVPRPVGVFLQVVSDVASSLFLAIFTWQLWKLFDETLSRNRIDETTLALPLAFIQWVLPLGGGLLLLTHILLAVRSAVERTYGNAARSVPEEAAIVPSRHAFAGQEPAA